MHATDTPKASPAPVSALERIDEVLRLSRSIIWEIDRAGIFTYVSPSFEDVLGYRPEEVVGRRSIYDFLPPDLPPHLESEKSRDWLDEPREFTNQEVPLQAKSGEIVWVASDGKPVFDEHGNLAGFRGADVDITARKQFQDSLSSREAELLGLITAAPVPMAYTVAEKPGAMRINAAFRETFGYTEADIPTVGDWFRVAYPDETYRAGVVRRNDELLARLARGERAAPEEYRITCKDGRVLDVQIDASIVGASFIGTFVDVTARRQSYERVRAEQSELRAMLDNLPFPVALSAAGPDFDWTDARAEISYINDSFIALFGYELADIPKAADFARAAFPDEGRRASAMAALEAQVQRALAGEPEAGPVEVRVAAKDGRELEVLFKAVAVRGGIVVSFLDLTERNRAARLLRANEETLRSLFEEAPIGIARLNLSSQRLWVNKAFTETLGYTAEDIPTLEDWMRRAYPDPDYRERVRSDWGRAAQKAMEGGGDIEDTEISVTAKDGSRHDMQFSGVIVGDEVFGMWVDFTERNRAERLLAEQREQIAHVGRVSALGELAASLAHELDQPLGAILNNAETARIILAGNKPKFSELGAIMDDIIEDDRRAGEVLDRIRAMVEKQPFRPRAVDVAQLLRETVSLVQAVAAKKRIRIEISCEPGLSRVEGDYVLLQQALLNLMLNSVDAIGTRSDGTISLRAGEADTGRVGISVSDNGGGVPPEDAALLLQPFHTTKERGLGMGLPIVNSIVEQHGGSLRVENQPGRGLTVVMVLSRWKEEARE